MFATHLSLKVFYTEYIKNAYNSITKKTMQYKTKNYFYKKFLKEDKWVVGEKMLSLSSHQGNAKKPTTTTKPQ